MLLLLSGPSAQAREPPPPRVTVDLTGCDTSLADEVRRIVGVELRAVVVDAADPGVAATRAVVSCHDAVVDLSVADAATSKLVVRSVSLVEMAPRTRARLIALAVAELVLASWEEIETNPRPKVAAAAPALPEVRASVRRAIEEQRRIAGDTAAQGPPLVTLDAMGEAQVFFGTGTFVFGGALRSAVRLASAVTLRLGAGADLGDVSRSSGDVAVSTAQGSVGVGWWLDRGVLCWIGAGAGFARLVGQARTNNVVGRAESGPWAGPEIGVDFILWPRAVVHGAVGVSAGATMVGVQGNVQGDTSVAVLGGWVAVGIGAGIAKP